ncbi:NAD-dependent epimerase/dehydratase family protein [Patescibacteria group bacterium]|jgi:nucleoside-diphosphate-sugar epimerase|nr:NAD-dependent epimerase/dehydratase family protein [Patescibacteria group bacterium]
MAMDRQEHSARARADKEARSSRGRTVFITGAAGYVGEMLCDQLAQRDDVAHLIGLDKEPQSDFSKRIPKLTYLQHNLADPGWQERVAPHEPDVIIHTAWQIRMLYGKSDVTWRWNVEGSQAVYDFAHATPSVQKLLHFSTASSYAAKVDNTFAHAFTEDEGFRDDPYLYAHEKKAAEDRLAATVAAAREAGKRTPQVVVFRPAAITGPRGRYMRIRFGLQSALSGNLSGGLMNRLVTLLTSWVPATAGWVRQFVHEDDVSDVVQYFTFHDAPSTYEVYNLTPDSEPVYAPDMARAVGKRILPIQPWMARIAFFFFWHTTRGKIPTAPHSWRFYSYPIIMSGTKLAAVHPCRYTSKEAFAHTSGRYEWAVPEDKRVPL